MAEETIYLCNFRVSVDGDWLCLKELNDFYMVSKYWKETEEGMVNIITKSRCLNIPIDTMFELFDKLVLPILNYECEI